MTARTLKDCKKSCKVRIVKLNAESDLRQRLISFGVMKDAEIEVLEHSPAKSTIEIKVGKMRIALRAKEAQKIEVEKL